MATYYVDDGGDNTDGSTWAKAYTSLYDLDQNVTFSGGDEIYMGHDHVDQHTYTGNTTFTAPSATLPVRLYSVEQGTTDYLASSTNQVDSSNGTYSLTFNGSWTLVGIRVKSGLGISVQHDSNTNVTVTNCYFDIAHSAVCNIGNNSKQLVNVRNLTLSYRDTVNTSNSALKFGGKLDVAGITFTNMTYRTGNIISFNATSTGDIVGVDWSAATAAAAMFDANPGSSYALDIRASHNHTPASPTIFSGFATATKAVTLATDQTANGSANGDSQMEYQDAIGRFTSTSSIYRTASAQSWTYNVSWLVTTGSDACGCTPTRSPWIYAHVGHVGPYDLVIYITNDTANWQDDDVWMEVQYKNDGDESTWVCFSDCAEPLVTPSGQQNDSSGVSWNGTGPSFTYKQKLVRRLEDSQGGLVRARVMCGTANVSSSRYFYIDPRIYVE